MASLTINPPPAKRPRTSAITTQNNNTSQIKTISLVPFIDDFINTMYDKLSNGNGELTPENKKGVLERMETMVHLKVRQQDKQCMEKVVKRDFSRLPGIDDICVKTIIPYLGNDGQALMNMFGKTTKRFLTVPTIRDIYYQNVLNRLNDRYETEFPEGTPLVCACEKGRLQDVKLFITCMNGINSNMTLREYVNQVGTNWGGWDKRPLMIAAKKGHFQVVQYLIEQGEADPNIADSDGWNVLHYAASNGRMTTELIKLLLSHLSLDSINKKTSIADSLSRLWWGSTPLGVAYACNRQYIIALLRQKGGKANKYDENGRIVGRGNGDLNVERHAVVIGSDIEVVREALTKIDDINEMDDYGQTVLDLAYLYNDSPIKQDIIALLRLKGGKANKYDANGRRVGRGNGDLNVERHAVVIGSDIEVVREALTKIDDINEMDDYGQTLLDLAYEYNDSPIKQEIIGLLRSKGGKSNIYDANGRRVGRGNGDF